MNSSTPRWLAFPGARSIHAEDGALLLSIEDGRCYSLNGVAARVWLTIARSPTGISFDGILDTLETHLVLTREAVKSTTIDCLAELQLAGLVGNVVGDNEDVNRPLRGLLSRAQFRGSGQEGDRTIISARRFVQQLETLESLVDRLFPQGGESGLDWRVTKLKNSIDNAPGKVTENLGHICSQLQLPLSGRQARRLFKDSAGISMKEYTRKRRLVFAAEQLQNTNEPVKVIAIDAGYRTYDGFRKAFYYMFRLTPVEFRRFWHRHQGAA